MSTARILAAFVRRDWAIARSYRLPFVMDLASTVVSLTLFFAIGRLVDRSSTLADARGYFAFVLVGLALFRVLRAGVMSFADHLRIEQTTGTLEAMLTTPTATSVLGLASGAYGIAEAVLAGAVTFALGVVLFGVRPHPGWAALTVGVAALALSVILFAAIGVAVAAFTVVFKQAGGLVGLVTTGLGLAGTVYVPAKSLPGPLRALSAVIPLTWSLQVLRPGLLEGQARPGPLLPLAGTCVVVVPAALWAFNAAIRRARQMGSLGHY